MQNFVGKVMSLLSNTLPRLVVAFLQGSLAITIMLYRSVTVSMGFRAKLPAAYHL